ncbi:unnamed protein product [Gadus morhua 'NCC']
MYHLRQNTPLRVQEPHRVHHPPPKSPPGEGRTTTPLLRAPKGPPPVSPEPPRVPADHHPSPQSPPGTTTPLPRPPRDHHPSPQTPQGSTGLIEAGSRRPCRGLAL